MLNFAGDVVERASLLFRATAAWMATPALTDLFSAVGASRPIAPSNSPPAGLDWLSSAHLETLDRAAELERSADVAFNFRAGCDGQYRERSQATAAEFDDITDARIVLLAAQLGLVTPRPPRYERYDQTLVLGGSYRSPLLRARYAAQLVERGLDLGVLTFLGSPRAMIHEPPEVPIVESYAPGATDEFDLMLGAATRELDLAARDTTFLCGCRSADGICPRWLGRHHELTASIPPAFTHERVAELVDPAGEIRGRVLSASTSRPPYRPNTSDTFGLYARHARLRPGQRILVITTQMFVPFQSFEAGRCLYLPYGFEVDTVGLGAEWGDRPQTAPYLLQETLSAIRSGRQLLLAAADVLRRRSSGN